MSEPEHIKRPEAVALGRTGGFIGGPARAAALSPERRREIARIAAMKRWASTPAPRRNPRPIMSLKELIAELKREQESLKRKAAKIEAFLEEYGEA